MQRIWLVLTLGVLAPAGMVAGCNAIAGIQEGLLAADASTDLTTESATPLESGPEAGLEAGTADTFRPGDAAATGALGSPCTSPSACAAHVCLPAGVCSIACDEAGACPRSWACARDGTGASVCTCTRTNGGVEACDGIDNDCDGVVDNDANAACVASGAGALSACLELDGGGPACVCATTDNQCQSDLCADLQHDAKNCGRCARDCQYPQGGGCDGGQCGAFTFVDSTMFDAGGVQRIAGLAVDSKYVYFSYSTSSSAVTTSILRCPANSPGACTSPETFVEGIEGGAGSISLDPASGGLAGTTGVPGGRAGIAYYVTPSPDGSTPSVVAEGVAFQNEDYFAGGVTNGFEVAWLDLEKLGIDMSFAGLAGSDFSTPTYSTSPNSPTVLLAVPAHSALYFGVSSPTGGQIWRCPMPGCGSPMSQAEVYDGNNLFGSPNALAYDGTSLYFAASGIAGGAGGVYAFALNQPTLTKLATAQNPKELTLDSSGRVYWIDAASAQPKIEWCLTTGCPPPPAPPHSIDVGSAPPTAGTSVLIADRTSLYWNAETPSGGGIVQRVALP